MPSSGSLAILATLDTKRAEVDYAVGILQDLGRETFVYDLGTSGPFAPKDAAGDPQSLLASVAEAVRADLIRRVGTGEIDGALGIAGGKGSATFGAIVHDLPYGFPALLVSSARPAMLAELGARKDLLLYPTLVDLFGINRFTARVLNNAASAAAGMRYERSSEITRAAVAITAFGVTTPAASRCADLVRSAGLDAIVFPANGAGGRTMEALMAAGEFAGVIDLTTTELADELVGGTASAGPDRLKAASTLGLPQLVAPGAVDMVNFGPRSTVPPRFDGRSFYAHTAFTTLMRTTPEECHRIGRLTGERLAASKGPCRVLFPRRGFSDYDKERRDFHDPAADWAWLEGLRETLPPSVPCDELDCHINDPVFADTAAAWVLEHIQEEVCP